MNSLKARLTAGDFVTAAWAELGNPDVAEILVRHGWKVIVIDGEHGTGALEDWVAVARAVEAAGGEVILRVPEASDALFKRVLDRGFRSLIVPLVNSVEDARAVARACRYPPRGTRGYAAPIVRASGFGARPGYAREESHQELLLFVQCESAAAVAALPEIAGVEGIDGIFLGPNDLSASLGHLERMDHADTRAAIAEVEAKAAAAGTILATITGPCGGWAELRAKGYGLAVGPNDISLLQQSARTAAEARDGELRGA
ncbi:MAG: aldolase/citrate lyase family protein [Paracoccaceae bacterium]|nr:aldolase/citrate lyase family protein [Paracoccaceae bacterium]